jgi:hypothetical protein
MESALIMLYLVAILVIGFLLYTLLNRPQTVKIYNEMPPPQRFETHWWGYGWRPWWRRYGGVPGFGPSKPLPEPKMPVPPKPLVV